MNYLIYEDKIFCQWFKISAQKALNEVFTCVALKIICRDFSSELMLDELTFKC